MIIAQTCPPDISIVARQKIIPSECNRVENNISDL
jgi:hypothetical protein